MRVVVPDLEEEEGDDYNDGNGPEVDELGAKNCSVAVCQHNEVVSLDIEESQDEESPSIDEDQTTPLLESIFVDRIRRVDQVEKNVVEEGLEGWNRSSLSRQKRRERIRRRNTNREDLPNRQSNPKLLCLDILEPSSLCLRILLQHLIPMSRHSIMRPISRARIGACCARLAYILRQIHAVALVRDDDAVGGVCLDWVHSVDSDFSRPGVKATATRFEALKVNRSCNTHSLSSYGRVVM